MARLVLKPSYRSFDPRHIVTNCEYYGKKRKIKDGDQIVEIKDFTSDGLFSKEIFGDIDTAVEYSCECGHKTGRFYDGKICGKCNTPVELIQPHIDKVGWIDLSGNKYDNDGKVVEYGDQFKVISYVKYQFLEQVIGREHLKNIIYLPNEITETGELNEESVKEKRELRPENKYYHLGIMGFYEKYNEVIDYYHEIMNGSCKLSYSMVQERDDVFTDKIMVLPIILRPALRTADGLKLDELNIIYGNILKYVSVLNNKVGKLALIQTTMLSIIQAQYFELMKKITENFKGKNRLIQGQICGTRINYSARVIISPAKGKYKIDEMVLPYQVFLEVYKLHIINYLVSLKKVTYAQAENMHFQATLKFDEYIYNIMDMMVKNKQVVGILNRNPTIAVGSALVIKVVAVKRDMNDLTMSIHNCILALLAGDYDGDVLNFMCINDKEFKEIAAKCFSPEALVIDPNDGKFNKRLSMERDQVLGINSFLI